MLAAFLCRLLLPLADVLEVLNPLVNIRSALRIFFRRQANRLIMQGRRKDRAFRISSDSIERSLRKAIVST